MSDLISRQDAIEAVKAKAKWFSGDAIEDRCKRDAFISVIDDVLTELPSADAVQIPIKLEKRYPQSRDEDITDAFMRGYLAGRSSADRPTGEWIKYNSTYRTAICSQCEKVTMFEKWGDKVRPYDFCPNCGSLNRGEGEEHETD